MAHLSLQTAHVTWLDLKMLKWGFRGGKLHVKDFWATAGCSDWAQRAAAAMEGQDTAGILPI